MITWFAQYLNFDYINQTGYSLPVSLFRYDFTQTQTSTDYTDPTFDIIQDITPYPMDWGFDWSEPISIGTHENITSQIFCDSINWSTLQDYEMTDIGTWVGRNDSTSQREEFSDWNLFASITCVSVFDHSEFQSQQFYDIKNILFYTWLVLFATFALLLLKPLFFWKKT